MLFLRAKDLDNGFFEKITTLDWKKESLQRHSDEVKVCWRLTIVKNKNTA